MADHRKDFKFYVIGAGLPRTGTFTLKKALEILLPGKCMHMFELLKEDDYTSLMNHVFNEKSSDQEFGNYFKDNNIVAGVDALFISVYKRALKVFPEAKVILTVRSAETWVDSMKRTVCNAQNDRPSYYFPHSFSGTLFRPLFSQFRKYLYEERILNGAVSSVLKCDGEKFFEDWVADVKRTVPSDRLLVYEVKEGWKPICEFLNLPVPKQPFPNSNNRYEFWKSIFIVRFRDWSSLMVLTSVVFTFGYVINKRFNLIDLIRNNANFMFWSNK